METSTHETSTDWSYPVLLSHLSQPFYDVFDGVLEVLH